MNLVSQYPFWYYFLCLLLGAILSYLLYKNDKKLQEFSAIKKNILRFLRFATISIVAILFLGPFIRYYSKKVNEPIIAIIQDNSASIIQNEDSAYYTTQFLKQREQLISDLAQNFEVHQFLLDEELTKSNDKPTFKGNITDLSKMNEDLSIRYLDQNLAAVICLTDGIYNQGLNPVYQERLSVPLYAVALGDTLVKKDVLVNRVLNNKIAFTGNEFPVELEIKTIKSKNELTQVQIWKGNKKVWQETARIDTDFGVIKLKTKLKAEEIGLNRYTVKLDSLNHEVNYNNNVADFYIDVIDAKQRILLLSDAPHPDIKAIREAIISKETFQVDYSKLEDFNGELKDFDLVILIDLFGSKSIKLSQLQEEIEINKTSALYLLGNKTQLTTWNSQDVVFEVVAKSSTSNAVQAKHNENFPLFKLDRKYINRIEKFPPLSSLFGNYLFVSQNFVLFNQKIGIVETESPLITFSEKQNQKIGVIAGEGLWKWRVNDFAFNGNHEAFDQLILKTVQYLAVKSDKSYFKISHKESYKENQKIRFEAQLYNESYEIINDAEVNITLFDENGNEYPFTFSPFQNAYQLNISALPIGSYNYVSTTELAGKTFTEKGQFSVKKIQLESAETTANHNLLFQLAIESGGKVVYPKDLNKLKEILQQREDLVATTYLEEELEEIINMKWIFFILISLLSFEWFIRKFGGAY